MIEIKGRVEGVEVVVRRLSGAGDKARERVRKRVQRLGIELLRSVKQDFLSGRALNVRSGRLRRETNEQTVVNGNVISSTVGTNVFYGGLWERGFSRIVGPGSRGGKAKKGGTSKKSYGPRAFLRPALAEMQPRIVEQLSQKLMDDGTE